MVGALPVLSGVAAGALLPTAIRQLSPTGPSARPLAPPSNDLPAEEVYQRGRQPAEQTAWPTYGPELRRRADQARPSSPTPDAAPAEGTGENPASPQANLSAEQQEQVAQLEKRDAEVRAHEQAHKAAAGAYGGAVSFQYETGPDGKRYAVGGEVQIDVSPIKGNPRATISKMQQVRRAAMAPAQPSSQDYRVASQASRLEAEARAELQKQQRSDASQDQPATPPGAIGAVPSFNAGHDEAEETPGQLLDISA